MTDRKAPVHRGLCSLLAALAACVTLGAIGPATSNATILMGINEGGEDLGGVKGAEDWESIGRSGADLFRVALSWERVAKHGNWREDAAWEAELDKIVQGSAEHGYTVLGLLAGRKDGTEHDAYYLDENEEKAEFAEYQEYVEMAVARYGVSGSFWTSHPELPARPITAWEVWNEPNTERFSPKGNVDPYKYADFLIKTSNSIKSAQASLLGAGESNPAVVLHAGLLQAGTKPMKASVFIERAAIIEGWSGAFDAFGLHPYKFGGSKEAKVKGVEDNTKEARDALNSHGAQNAPIWITELGWPVEGNIEQTVSQSEQKELLTESFTWAKTGAYNVDAVVWYNFHDQVGELWDQHCGLRRVNGTFRPAWYAFQAQTGASKWPFGPYVDAAFSDASNSNTISFWRYDSEKGWQTAHLWGREVAAGTKPAVLDYEGSSHIFFVDASRGNKITEWAWSEKNGWELHLIDSDPVASGSSPSAVIDNGQPQLYFSDSVTNGGVTALAYAGGSWSQTRFYGHAVAENTSPSAISNSGTEIFFVDASRENKITEWSWNSKTGWQQSFIASDPVATGSSPSAVNVNGQSQVYFSDPVINDGISVLARSGSTWNQTWFYGDPVAENTSPSAISTPGSVQIYFADGAKGNTMAVWVWSSSIYQTFLYQDSVAENSSPSAVYDGGESKVYFADESTNGSIALWKWGSTLEQVRLYGHLSTAGSSPGAG